MYFHKSNPRKLKADSLFSFFQLALFNFHVFKFTGFEDFTAFQAFHKLGVFFAGDYAYTGVFALGQIIRHRGRLGRAGCGHRFRISLPQARAPRRLAPELAVFLFPTWIVVKHRIMP
jgi:hypothetical protein